MAQPRGFCAGVIRAVEIVESALAIHGAPVYVLHEIVHNQHVVQDLTERGAIFVESLEEVPPQAVIIFSAHGVANAVVQQARERELRFIDATCPLVTKVHRQAQGYHNAGRELIIIGHGGHPEVKGTRGRVDGPVYVISTPEEANALQVRNPQALAYVTQTTLSLDDTREVVAALKARFPEIQGPGLNDICYATQNRQNAVRELARQVDVLLVVGARNSSNSNRLREVGEHFGIRSYLVQTADDLEPGWFSQCERVGVTAGASAPEVLVQQVLDRLHALGADSFIELAGVKEATRFRLPPMLG